MKTYAQDGFTLPEVLVSVAVFGIASIGLVASLLMNVRSNRMSNEISEASTAAQSVMEYERGKTIASSVTTCPTGWPTVPSLYTVTCTLGATGTPVAGTRSLTVTLSWEDAGARSVTLQSYVTY